MPTVESEVCPELLRWAETRGAPDRTLSPRICSSSVTVLISGLWNKPNIHVKDSEDGRQRKPPWADMDDTIPVTMLLP